MGLWRGTTLEEVESDPCWSPVVPSHALDDTFVSGTGLGTQETDSPSRLPAYQQSSRKALRIYTDTRFLTWRHGSQRVYLWTNGDLWTFPYMCVFLRSVASLIFLEGPLSQKRPNHLVYLPLFYTHTDTDTHTQTHPPTPTHTHIPPTLEKPRLVSPNPFLFRKAGRGKGLAQGLTVSWD